MEASEPVTTTEGTPPEDAAPAQGPTTDELLSELVQHQREQRAEIQQLRDELAKSRAPAPPAQSASVRSQEDLLRERMEQIAGADFYCPACGKLGKYPRECQGTGAAPHPAVEMVSTDELKSGDSTQHTAAPGVA